MQLPASAIEPVAANRRVDTLTVLRVEVVAKPAEFLVGFPHVFELEHDQLDDDHVVEITDDRHVVGQNVFGIAEIDKSCQQAVALAGG